MPITVVAWNIQKGFGLDGKRDLDRQADIIESLAPDVVGLEEVVRAEGSDQAAQLAARLRMTLAWGPARATKGGTYGNALLVRGEVERVDVHDLSVDGREPRACLDATVVVRNTTLRVLVCHFGLGWRERAIQANKLADAIGDAYAFPPRIVLGDFNEPNRGPVTRLFERVFPAAPRARPSHPALLPVLPLDRLVWDDGLVGSVDVVPVRWASDHRPLRAVLSPGG